GKVAEQIYSLRRRALDTIIEQKLLEAAAAEKNVTVDQLLKEEVGAAVPEPSEAEIKAIYDANKERFGGTFEQARPQIVSVLKRNREGAQQQQFLAGLQQKHTVEIKLEKPPVERVKVAVGPEDPCLGPEGAAVTLIEFTDFQCPFCGRARAAIDQVLETYKKDVRYCYRDFPLGFHQDAQAAGIASQCAFEQNADQGWKYFRTLFDNQQSLKPDHLKKYAKEAGLDSKSFNQCLDSRKYAEEVQQDLDEGSKAGVTGTPGFFVNGILISGAQPFSKFKEVIDDELKK
ncbi:MAG: DsbA family protein, partial [Deltaproteobacteria bacterium]|nr:DsbA family protein [Deltaproteobacteria bacterium]